MNRLYSEDRLQIQPAFVYAVLAMARLMKSSKLESGSVGLSQAMDLINEAHAAYKDAVELQCLDISLVEAAFVSSFPASIAKDLITPRLRFCHSLNHLSIPNTPLSGYELLLLILMHSFEICHSQISILMIVLLAGFLQDACLSSYLTSL